MIKRTLHFGNPAYLSKQNEQMLIDLPHLKGLGEKDSKKIVPIEDIGMVILDHQQITITQACIAALLQNNAAIITCDHMHHPTGLMLPLDGSNMQSKYFRHQIEASEPLKKQLWQQTIQAKIINQASLLKRHGIDIDNMLYWAKSVRSGDPDNYEGRAAAYYWRYLFPPDLTFFRRREGEPPNNLLNYGYAVLRAIVARGLVSSGLLPTLGIHHRNQYNAYCLADDIMEPYRPFVDEIVVRIVENGEDFTELSPSLKAQLLGIASVDIQFGKDTSPLMVGLQKTTSSLAKCYEGKLRKITYPVLTTDGNDKKIYRTSKKNLPIAAEPPAEYEAEE